MSSDGTERMHGHLHTHWSPNSCTAPQRTHGVIITSLSRQNDVATSFWRYNDVNVTSCVPSGSQSVNFKLTSHRDVWVYSTQQDTTDVIYHTISYHIIPYHIISYIIPYHTIPYHTIPYHTIPYHIISYHIISYTNNNITLIHQDL